MSDGIYYNQEVTADMLNDIAVDLGATSFNGFGEDKFGADALNGITSALVSKGVLTTDSMCAPIISNGKLYIQPGTIVFDNGAKKVITSATEVELVNSSCIYALNDVAAGTCSIIVSEAFPESGDFVKLATVDADGKMSDIRDFASGKAALLNEIIYDTFDVNLEPNYGESRDDQLFYKSKAASYQLINPAAKYLILTNAPYSGNRYVLSWFVEISTATQYIDINPGSIKREIAIKREGNLLRFYGRGYMDAIVCSFLAV